MNSFSVNTGQLRHPLPNILPTLIKLLALEERIENPEVRLWIHTRTRTKPPTAIVGSKVAVDEVLHEVCLAHPPINQQILSQKGPNNHSAPIMHIPHPLQLPHSRVHNRETRLSLAPLPERSVVVLPFNIIVLVLKRLPHTHIRPMGQDMLIEIPPRDFANPACDPCVAGI